MKKWRYYPYGGLILVRSVPKNKAHDETGLTTIQEIPFI
jgi:hypothetical protein